MDNNYKFTDLADNQQLVEDIRSLEKKIEDTIGAKVNLVAYSPVKGESDKVQFV
ncbi:hypothetical protein D3C79_1087880 [compost metagenome]